MNDNNTTGVALRMRDVAIALHVSSGHGQFLNRIRLQKFIYLMDAVAIVYKEIPQSEGYVTFKHGPFDRRVQNAVDALAFRGLVCITNLSRGEQGTFSVEYSLTDAGRQWARRVTTEAAFGERATIGAEVGRRVDALGWSRLRELVYSEPTFVGLRPSGYGQTLHTSDGLENSSARLISVIIRSLSADGSHPTRQSVLDVYFRYLDTYATAQHVRGAAG